MTEWAVASKISLQFVGGWLLAFDAKELISTTFTKTIETREYSTSFVVYMNPYKQCDNIPYLCQSCSTDWQVRRTLAIHQPSCFHAELVPPYAYGRLQGCSSGRKYGRECWWSSGGMLMRNSSLRWKGTFCWWASLDHSQASNDWTVAWWLQSDKCV